VLADPGAPGISGQARILLVPAPQLCSTVLVRPDGYIEALGLDTTQAEE
jgi:hypothetical protein